MQNIFQSCESLVTIESMSFHSVTHALGLMTSTEVVTNFPHFNLIVYLTDTGGETFVEDEIHIPKIHDVILFRGKHYMKRPTRDRRIILVATILPTDDNGLELIGLQSNHDKIAATNGD